MAAQSQALFASSARLSLRDNPKTDAKRCALAPAWRQELQPVLQAPRSPEAQQHRRFRGRACPRPAFQPAILQECLRGLSHPLPSAR